ncbi:hypothetical protein L7F22_012553 [Adiantum nelumboides]|nr:hypothetical protein [Adiantum nelumboides]
MRSKAGPPAVANGSVPHLEAESLTEELKAFKVERFDADSYVQSHCQTMSEKGIRTLCSELLRLKKASAEEMRRSVYANYTAFIRTSQEISDLEGELVSMRNLLSSQASLVRGLAEGAQLDSLPNGKSSASDVSSFSEEHLQHSADETRLQALSDALDVLIAERRTNEALSALFEGEKLIASNESSSSVWMLLSERRARLREQLVQVARQPSTRGRELCATIQALYRLGDGPCAHTLLLTAHSQKLHNNVQELRASGTTYGGAYTAALSQLVFSVISQAAKDSQLVFGEQAAYASELVLWASDETASFASLLKRHVLMSAAAAGGLRAAAECVQVALGYCSLLEQQGLALCPTLLKLFRPTVEQALQANLRHIEESVSVLAAADNWVVYHTSGPARLGNRNHLSGTLVTQSKLTSSAHRFQSLIQDFLDDVGPLINLQLGGLMLDGLVQVFESYIELLMMAVPGPLDDSLPAQADHKSVKAADLESQQLGLLGNASALADDILPRVAAKLLPSQSSVAKDDLRKRTPDRATAASSRTPELKEWRRRWQRMVDKLRDHYCRQQVVDLMFTEDEANFSFDIYLNLEDENINLEILPSPIFQKLFFKLNKLSHVAADIVAGRERMTAMLFMRLVETFVLFIFEDQEFWEELENGYNVLGPAGLQQFVLDMQFVIQIASHGRYLTRHIKAVIADIITRAVEAFSRTGLDPNSVLPENDWFLTTAQSSVQKLLIEFSRGDLASPTASVSAHSMSSTRSHGSP